LKFYGLHRCIEGGAGKPFAQRLCGTCPTWKSRNLRIGVPILFVAIGLAVFGLLAAEIYLGHPIDLPLGRNKSVQVGSAILSASAFLFFIWWLFTMVQARRAAAMAKRRAIP